MKILIDSNVVLDILLHREPWYINAALIFGLTEENFINSYVSASSITDIFYISQKQLGKSAAKKSIKQLFSVFRPATVTDNAIYQALELEWEDFEDSVQYIVGQGLFIDHIITRDIQDFSSASINTLTPDQFIMTIVNDV